MDHPALKTLFLPFENGLLERTGRAVFFGALDYPDLKDFEEISCVQHWAGPAAALRAKGYEVLNDPPEDQTFNLALCLVPKQKEEALGMLARAASVLEKDGVLITAAANDANGSRLEKWLKELGSAPQNLSKHKARVVWASGPFDLQKVQEWINDAAPREIEMDGQSWWTQPGIFGWNKIDAGSKLLIQNLPDNLAGDIADFGCGYGYLSRAIINQNLKSVTAIDADVRALEMCKKNIPQAKTIHADLTAPPDLGMFDTIIMNPPFHTGKERDSDIGLAFIKTAVAHLKPGGDLYMVANAHLPYEKELGSLFKTVQKLEEAEGFKVFKAQK